MSTTPTNLPQWDRSSHSRYLDVPKMFRPGMRHLTEESLTLLAQEKSGNFRRIEGVEIPDLDPDLRGSVGIGEVECPLCRGNGEVPTPCEGVVTGVKVLWPLPCKCKLYERYYKRWWNPDYVARDYRECTMDNLLSGVLKSRFRKLGEKGYATVITAIQQFPTHNCLMVGPGGTGKTTLMTAMLDKALRDWAQRSYDNHLATEAIWKVKARDLAKQQHEWEMQIKENEGKDGEVSIKRPIVTAYKIRAAVAKPNNFRAFVGIDEFDKYKLNSDFQNGEFHSILDECQSNTGQVMCNSNLDIGMLMARIGDQYASPMLRRLVGGPRGMYIHFGEGKVYVNNVLHRLVKSELVPVPGQTLDTRFDVLPSPGGTVSSPSVTTQPTYTAPHSPQRSNTPAHHGGTPRRTASAGKGAVKSTKYLD
jgi:hypothetical protein